MAHKVIIKFRYSAIHSKIKMNDVYTETYFYVGKLIIWYGKKKEIRASAFFISTINDGQMPKMRFLRKHKDKESAR